MRAVRRRTRQLLIFVVAIHIVLVGRLFWVQVVEASIWKRLVREQQTMTQRLRPRRGAILDREGRQLATASARYRLFVVPRKIGERTWRCERCLRTVFLKSKTLPRRCLDCRAGPERFVELTAPPEERDATIAHFLDMEPAEFRRLVEKALAKARRSKTRPHDPRKMRVRVPHELRVEFELHPFRYPGLEVRADRGRHYHEPDVMPHLVGHVATALDADLERLKRHGFRWNDLMITNVGRTGIERTQDSRLIGRMGYRVVEFHRAGRVLELIEETRPTAGDDITLSVDLDLQRAAEKALDGRGEQPCAFTAIDVRTGEVLAAATAPRFRVSDESEYAKRFADNLYMHERSYGEARTPGSVFKIVTALALLKKPGFDPRAKVRCGAVFVRGRTRIRCNSIRHGELDLTEAIQRSCNLYFVRMSLQLGGQALHDAAAELGIGVDPGVEVAASAGKNIDPRKTADLWYGAFGQGSVQVTPLQMARIAAFVANDGRLPPLSFLRGGTAAKEWSRPAPAGLLRPVWEGMKRVVDRAGGTAHGRGLAPFGIAAKTGTAETGSLPPNRAWLVGFAPVENPEVAFACLVDKTTGHGGDVCAPIVKAWFEAWTAKKQAASAAEIVRAPPVDDGR